MTYSQPKFIEDILDKHNRDTVIYTSEFVGYWSGNVSSLFHEDDLYEDPAYGARSGRSIGLGPSTAGSLTRSRTSLLQELVSDLSCLHQRAWGTVAAGQR
jgi:hypothetical protein